MYKNEIVDFIDKNKNIFIEVNNKIWEYAETKFEEYKSSKLLIDLFKSYGFEVEEKVADLNTAFVAKYINGKTKIGILGEYDALELLSQKNNVNYKDPIIKKGNGHGCGHNIIAAATFASAIAIKDIIERHNISGSIYYFGCPGEEGGRGKSIMAEKHIFDDIDIAIGFHPWSYNTTISAAALANREVSFKFKGISSHAALSPHLGRSALDAVELMNVGANYLREHIIPEARFHYSMIDSGGKSPNIVPCSAEVMYLIRAPKTKDVNAIYDRIVKIAQGAALMTETTLEVNKGRGLPNLIINTKLEKLLYNSMIEIGNIKFEDEDLDIANSFRSTLSEEDIISDYNSIISKNNELSSEIDEKLSKAVLVDFPVPYKPSNTTGAFSTDVAEVSWIVPTAQVHTACYCVGTPPHSWQLVGQGATSVAHKGMLYAAKVLSYSILKLYKNDNLVKESKDEFRRSLEKQL